MDLEQLLAAAEQEEERFLWEGTFAQYLRMAVEKPAITRLSHARVHDMITSNGVETGTHGERIYGLFKDQVFGMDGPLDRLAQHFASAAQRFEIRKRILLLLGPPASGKSSIVNLIKRGLERYTRGEDGVLYAIKGCPMQEEPLHLIPKELRAQVLEEFGLYIEGDLCPRCGYALRNQYNGRISDVEVRRIALSERESAGIGSFVSSDPGSQNLGLLVGSIDTSQMSGDRLDVAGRAYRLDGELNVANRGVMEFSEFFKTEEPLLRVLLGLAQEQEIKMGRFGSVYADEALIAHSNEGDFVEFSADPKTAALLDRIITIKVPYNLKVSQEQQIYDLMLQGVGFKEAGVHVSPLALPVIATFAVLSRFDPPDKQGMSLADKIRLYDGQHVMPYTHEDLAKMQEESPDEGMSGVSPRYVLNKLSNVVTDRSHGCVLALTALDELWKGLSEHIALATSDRARYTVLLQEAIKQHDHLARTAVRRAYVDEFDREASRVFDLYSASVHAYRQSSKMVDPSTGIETPPDERAMRRLEEKIGINERSKAKFRSEVCESLANAVNMGLKPSYATVPQIREAIEQMLFPDPKELERTLFPASRREVEDQRNKAAMLQRLVKLYGYCNDCAQDLIDYVGFSLRGGQAIRVTRANRVRWDWKLR